MNKVVKLLIATAAMTVAVLFIPACKKLSEEELEIKRMLARENTLSGTKRIVSFYLNDKLCFDIDTYLNSFHLSSGFNSVKIEGSNPPILTCRIYYDDDSSELQIMWIKFFISEDNGVPQTENVFAEICGTFKGNGYRIQNLPVSHFSIEKDIIDKNKTRWLYGRFEMHFEPNELNPDIPEFDIKDGLFCAHTI